MEDSPPSDQQITDRWVLGPDPDTTVFLQLSWALRQFDVKVSPDWNTADLANFPMDFPDGRLLIQTETPQGIVVSGPAMLVARLKAAYESLRPNSTL